jgi:arsenate reductase-like glutaredoxin family protein
MADLIIYGVKGCGPCEVAKVFFKQQRIDYHFVDLNQDQLSRRDLLTRLETPTSGVVLEVGDTLDTIQGVSLASLKRWLEQHPELTR